jgi:hypothetical protein
MSKVIRLETGECRKSSDLRQEKDRVLLQNPAGFFDLYSFTKAAAAGKCRKSSACRRLPTCTTVTRTMHHNRDKIDIFYKVNRQYLTCHAIS